MVKTGLKYFKQSENSENFFIGEVSSALRHNELINFY